jgi:hypothetical protein
MAMNANVDSRNMIHPSALLELLGRSVGLPAGPVPDAGCPFYHRYRQRAPNGCTFPRKEAPF